MASDLIDRGALQLERYGEEVISWYATGWNDAINAINRAPSVDAVEVVRCKDCAHKRNEGPILRCPYSTVDLMPGGYCDKGLPNAMREGLQNIKESGGADMPKNE